MTELWKLPVGWRWAEFDEVARVASDLVDPSRFGTLPHIAPNHIESQSGRLLPFRTIAEDGVTSPKHRFHASQVLYSKIRPYLAKVVIAGFDGLCSADIYPIDTQLDSRFLKWWMLTPVFTRMASGEQGRTVLPKINKRALGRLPVPVPPDEEQRRIVDILEDHLSRLDVAELSVRKSMVKAEQLPRHLLTRGLRGALVPDDLSEGSGADLISKAIRFQPRASDRIWTTPNHWVWARLGDVFQVNVGSTPSRANPGFWKGDLPWVSSGEVAFNRITRTRENIAFEAAGNPAARIHPPGTVLLAMIGEGKTRGQCAILDITAAHNQNCASIRVPETRILSEYVYGYLEERYLETRRSGSGGQQPALNKRTIQNFPVPVAPLGTQRRLVAAWSAARETTGRLREELGKATTRAQVLRRALLNAAFSGRLTGRSSDLDRVRELAGV